MFVNDKVLELGRDERSLFAFFHAQRTGGSDFLRWLSDIFPKGQVFTRPALQADYDHWYKIDAKRLDGFRLIGGFSHYCEKEDFDRPFVGITLIRHPFYRIVSLYEMSRRDTQHYRHAQAMRCTFEQFYQEVDKEEPSYLHNIACNRVSNSASADESIEMLSRRFGVAGTTTKLRDMTELLIRTYGWSAEPMLPMISDELRYRPYASSPVFADVLEKSAEDMKLYKYVRDFDRRREGAVDANGKPIVLRSDDIDAPEAADRPRLCPLCGAILGPPTEKGDCPGCKSPARTRSLPAVLDQIVAPQLAKAKLAELPLLAFAATGWERKILAPHFPNVRGASLYGKYATDNTIGVDVRDLSRYPAKSFSGAFGILLFDYFPEHEKALAELARVIAPGGIFFTLILQTRIKPDASPPGVTRVIHPRPGYFDYVPEGGLLLNVNVGQDWLLGAIDRAGFKALQLRVPDGMTNEVSQWFIGIREEDPVAVPTESKAAEAPVAPVTAEKPAAPALAKQTRMTERFSQEFVCPLDGYDGLKSVTVRLTIPSIPFAGRQTDFGEHRWLASQNRSTKEVSCVGPGQLMVSDDLGENWDIVEPPELAEKRVMNHFTTEAGTRIVQLQGWLGQVAETRPAEEWGAIYRLDPKGSVTGAAKNGDARWHGPRAIGEQNGVILYADYQDNLGIYNRKSDDWAETVRANHVWRSDDDAQSWRQVFSVDPTQIRHFHFVIADPYRPGSWWLSSGDRPGECHMWRTDDNGGSWKDVTNPAPDVPLHPLAKNYARAVFRSTDMAVLPDKLIWGTDDILVAHEHFSLDASPPMRARIYAAARSDKLEPVELGIGSQPFRNLVDVGPGYLAFTEAKFITLGLEPQVFFLSKQPPHRMQLLFSVPNVRQIGTGFSYSRASRTAVDGRFFSFRGLGDLANQAPRLLQWDVAFA